MNRACQEALLSRARCSVYAAEIISDGFRTGSAIAYRVSRIIRILRAGSFNSDARSATKARRLPKMLIGVRRASEPLFFKTSHSKLGVWTFQPQSTFMSLAATALRFAIT